jgi:hypothetical protein
MLYLGFSESAPLLSPQGDRGLTGTPGEPGVKVCRACGVLGSIQVMLGSDLFCSPRVNGDILVPWDPR